MLYPSTNSDDFESVISNKAEFRELLDVGVLFPHQELIRRYMSPYTPYDRLLLYHSMGTGKTFIAICVAEDHYNCTGKKCIVLTKGETAYNNYISQIQRWLKKRDPNITIRELKRYISARYKFYHHISFCKDKLMKGTINPDLLNNVILVIDEVHNINPGFSANSNPIYDALKAYIRGLSNSKVLLLSGTPMTNDLRKILSILEMILPEGVRVSGEVLHDKLILYDAIKGYISCYFEQHGMAEKRYMGTTVEDLDHPIYISYMKGIQKRVYIKAQSVSDGNTIYNLDINASLFVFSDGTYANDIHKTKLIAKEIRVNEFVSAFMKERRTKYRCKKYVVAKRYQADIEYDKLPEHSCKYHAVIKEILSRPRQTCFVYIREIVGSGLLLFSAILENMGYELYYGQDLSNIAKKPRYTVCVGDVDVSPNNRDRIAGFNDPLNRYGDYVKVIIGSNVTSESISLMNVRHFHCLSPHWNSSLVDQAIKRTIRRGSHEDLLPSERLVDIYLHISYLSDGIPSVDVRKLAISQHKEVKLDPVKRNLKYCSIENILSNYPYDRLDLDCSTYEPHITDKMLDEYVNSLRPIIGSMMSVGKISLMANLPIPVLKSVLSYMISDNLPVRDHYGRTSYVRETRGIITLTRNYKSYSLGIDTSDKMLFYKCDSTKRSKYDPMYFINSHEDKDAIYIIECMTLLSWEEKISVIEKSIELNNRIAFIFKTSILSMDNVIYHVYNYRKSSKGSYSSSAKGIKRSGLTRAYANGSWYNVAGEDEVNVIFAYRKCMRNMEIDHSIEGKLYWYSTVDCLVRVSVLKYDDIDQRRIRRGRSIITLPISDIIECYLSLYNEMVPERNMIDMIVQKVSKMDMLMYI